MNLYDVALAIYLKRLPSGALHDQTALGFASVAEQSIEMAQVFIDAVGKHKQQAAADAAADLPGDEL